MAEFVKGGAAMQLVCMDPASGRTLDWRHCDTTKIAAALATLGVPVTTEKVWRDWEGDERVTYHHGPRSLTAPDMPPAKVLVNRWRDGSLFQADPKHPFLDSLRVIRNLLALRAWAEQGTPQHLGYVTQDRCIYSPGPDKDLQATQLIRLKSIHKAAALGLCGYAVIRLEESEKGRPSFIINDACSIPALRCASDVIGRHKDGTMAKDDPFLHALTTADAYDRLLAHVQDELTMLMFKARGDQRYCWLPEQHSSKAIAKSDAFILGKA